MTLMMVSSRSVSELQSPQQIEKRLKDFQPQSFEPFFLRPAPPFLEPQPDEV
jgi:hypothetical protein